MTIVKPNPGKHNYWLEKELPVPGNLYIQIVRPREKHTNGFMFRIIRKEKVYNVSSGFGYGNGSKAEYERDEVLHSSKETRPYLESLMAAYLVYYREFAY